MWIRIALVFIIAWADGASRHRRQGFIDLGINSIRCNNPYGQVGVCLPIRQCRPLVNLLVTRSKAPGVADFLRKSVCGFQGIDPKVCCVGEKGFVDLGSTSIRCRNPDGEIGECLPIRECKPLVDLLVTRSKDPGVVRFLQRSVCGFQGIDPKVCCVREKESLEALPKTANKTDIQSELPDDPSKDTSSGTRLPRNGECGQVDKKHTRVVGGVNATLGAWPWMAALGYKSTQGGTKPVFLCAGSLISQQHILTAAHCITRQKTPYMARLGDHNLYEDNDGASPIDARVAKTITHENYDPAAFVNDIGIIILDQPVTYTSFIKPICLPLSREMRSKDFLKRLPFIAGWGSVSFAGPSSATLLELQVPVVAESECKRAFQTFKSAVIDNRVICAGYLRGGKDACRGDSGGPLMDYNNPDGLFYQIGVVSYGYKCAEQGFPGIYTRVTTFADWIANKVETTP